MTSKIEMNSKIKISLKKTTSLLKMTSKLSRIILLCPLLPLQSFLCRRCVLLRIRNNPKDAPHDKVHKRTKKELSTHIQRNFLKLFFGVYLFKKIRFPLPRINNQRFCVHFDTILAQKHNNLYTQNYPGLYLNLAPPPSPPIYTLCFTKSLVFSETHRPLFGHCPKFCDFF